MGATTTTAARPAGPHDDARDLVVATIAEHAASVLGVARRHSMCTDDAHDAYQRGLEIFLRRAGSVHPETAAAWLRTVVKHEALEIRAARRRVLTDEGLDPDREEARHQPAAHERMLERERVGQSAEALQRLKPQEVRALLLKARGYSYAEIQEITGWTYTKVNRCLAEGRRAFLDRYAEIEAGRECERWEPLLSAIADGEASPADLIAARPHLRNCPSCRAALREYRSAPGGVAALVPVGALASGPTERPHGVLLRLYEAVAGGAHERATLAAFKLQSAVETLSAGKVAAVAASATALAGGGAAIVDGSRAQVARGPAVARAAEAEPVKPSAAAARVAPPPSAVGAESHPRAAAPDPPSAAVSPAPESATGEFTVSGAEPESAAPAARAPVASSPRAAPAAPTQSTQAGAGAGEFIP